MSSLSPRARILVAWLPAVLYTLLIWWLSSQVLRVPYMERVPLQDKGVHFLEYGALSLFITHAVATTWQRRGVRVLLASSVITIALGLLDELHQAFVPGRSSDELDLLADAAGAVFFSASYLLIVRLLRGVRAGRGRDTESAREPGRGDAISEPPAQ